MICWPGWLDNAASFDSLLPFLFTSSAVTVQGNGRHANAKSLYAVAVDPPGCGRSDPCHSASYYSTTEEAALLFYIADALGWTDKPFTIMAHSRGGTVALKAAGSIPERVKSIILLDTLWGFPCPTETYPSEMRSTLKRDFAISQHKMREFESCEELVEHNWKNLQFPKEYHTARAIALRHAVELGHHRWGFSHDKRHYGVGSPLPQTESDINNSLRNITAPVLLVLAEEGICNRSLNSADLAKVLDAERGAQLIEFFSARRKAIERKKKMIPGHCEVTFVPGKHHMHSDEPVTTAAVLTPWLQRFVLGGSSTPTDALRSKL